MTLFRLQPKSSLSRFEMKIWVRVIPSFSDVTYVCPCIDSLNRINLSCPGDVVRRIPTIVTETRDRDHLELVTSERRNVGHTQGYLKRISELFMEQYE